jgi:neutral trehalase
MSVFTTDLTQEDCSLFLPLWAGMPSEEQACHLIDESLWPRYLMPYGLALVPPGQHLQEELPGLHTAVASALLPWNHLIGEGLLRYGRQAQAADLVTRLMSAVVDSLKTHQAFRQYYHAETGLAAGERGHLHGLAPLGLFLQTLGIRQLSAKEIILDGFNPFPWTIHVQYRKAHLTFYSDKTEVTFSGGQRITVDRPGIHQITLS